LFYYNTIAAIAYMTTVAYKNIQICFMLNLGQYWRKKIVGHEGQKIKITESWKKVWETLGP